MMNFIHGIGWRGITAAFLMVFALAPIGAYAQTDDLATLVAQLQEQIAELQTRINALQTQGGSDSPPAGGGGSSSTSLGSSSGGAVSCPTISRGLYLGSQGNDVTQLQQFLRESGYFTYPINTGYFGPSTERAVQLFQSAQGIVSSGDAETTGYGVVGPGTRAAIAAVCSSGTPPSTTPTGAITVRVSSVTVAPGETVAIPVTISNSQGQEFSAYDAKIYFNPNVISILGVEKNGTLSSDMALASNVVGGNVLQVSAAIGGGKISQSGTLFTIRAKALTAGLSNLTISSFVFDDGSPSAYPISGSVTVRSPQDDTPYVPPPPYPPIPPVPPSTTNHAPVISGVAGPQQLNVSQAGTWQISASDPDGGSLSYSVWWGDEALGASSTAAPSVPAFTQTATFTHTYYQGGTYTPVFTVKDSQGLTAQSSISVNVGGVTTQQPSITVTSPNGGEVWYPGETRRVSWQSTGVNKVVPYIYDSNIFGSGSTNYITPYTGIEISAAPGYFDWTIPPLTQLPPFNQTTGSNNFRIRIDDVDNGTGNVTVRDSSDAPFSIVSSQTQTKSVSLSATPMSGQAPLAVSFTGTLANFPSCGNSVTWTWGDNTSESLSEYCSGIVNVFASRTITRSHAYQTPGTYLARLTVGGIPSNDIAITVTSAPVQPLPPPAITVSSVPIAQQVTAYTNQFAFTNYIASAGNTNAIMTSFNARLRSSGNHANLSNCKLYDGSIALTNGANVVNPIFINADVYTYTFNFDNAFTVLAGTSRTFSVRCDITGNTPSGTTYAWGFSDLWGQTMTVVQQGSLSVAIDSGTSGSLPYREIIAGTQNVELVRIKFSASNEDINVRQVALQLSDTQYNTPVDLVGQKVTLWDGTTQIGEAIFGGGDTAIGVISTFRIPNGGAKILTIRGTIAAISANGPLTQPGDVLKVDYDGDAAGPNGTYGTGASSGSTIIPSGGDTHSNGIKIIGESISTPQQPTPAVSLVVLSPNGGEQWKHGLLKSIKWYGANLGTVALNINLLNEAGAVVRNIGTNVSNGQPYYSWTVPADVAAGKFMVKISSSDNTASDSSDLAFSVMSSTQSAASLAVTSPIKGDNWSASSLKPVITWQSTNIPSSNAVTIGLKNLSTGSQYLVLRDTFNDGSQAISISTIPSGTYSLFLYSVVGNDVVYGWGDAFTIGTVASNAQLSGLASIMNALQALIDQLSQLLAR